MDCESCGYPMENPQDHGGFDPACPYCICCAPSGRLKPRDEIRSGWADALAGIRQISREQALAEVDIIMPTMPAWKENR